MWLKCDKSPWVIAGPCSAESRQQVIATARELETDTVRIMSGRKEMIIFGENGAEQWVDASRAVDRIRGRFGPEAIGPAALAHPVAQPRPGERPWGPDGPAGP